MIDSSKELGQAPCANTWPHLTEALHPNTQGTVIIVANEGSRIDIPDGSELEDSVVTGSLRILEH